MILFLDGYRHTFLAELFGVSRMTLTRWVHRLNRQGLAGLREMPGVLEGAGKVHQVLVDQGVVDPGHRPQQSGYSSQLRLGPRSGPAHPTNRPPAPTVIRALEAESRALWAAAGSVGWPHAGVSFAPTVRRAVEGSAGTVLVASFGLGLEACPRRLPSGQGRRCREIRRRVKKDSVNGGRTKC